MAFGKGIKVDEENLSDSDKETLKKLNSEFAEIEKSIFEMSKEYGISPIDILNKQIEEEYKKNKKLISSLEMLKDILNKKEYDLLHMSDKEKLEAKIIKRGIS